MDPTYPLIPIVNFLSFVLVVLPLLTKFRRAWNTGVCMLAIWIAVETFTNGVNSIVWSDNVKNVAPTWCDITSHILIGGWAAKSACSLVITRRLYLILRLREREPSARGQIRRELLFDLSLCLGFPIVIIGVYYTVQASRYQIIEEVGCVDSIAAVGLSLVVVIMWPIILCCISVLFYCPRILLFFYRRRRDVNQYFSNSSTISRPQYFRIMLLGGLDILLTLPINTIQFVSLASAFSTEFGFWPGWDFVHSHWKPYFALSSQWRTNTWRIIINYYGELCNFPLAIAFFLIFGLTEDSRQSYKQVLSLALSCLGYKPPDMSGSGRFEPSAIHFQSNPVGRSDGDELTSLDESMREIEVNLDCLSDEEKKVHTGAVLPRCRTP